MNKAIKIFGILSFSLLICSAGLFNSASTTQAHGDGDGHIAGQIAGAVTTNGTVNEALRADINRENGNLYSELSKYSKATKKGPELEKLIAIAKVRKEKMLEQARTNPTDFLNTALPASTYNKLPGAVQNYSEKAIQIEGKLRVTHLDGINGKDLPNKYELVDSITQKVYNLNFGRGEIPPSKTGSVVKATGLYLDTDVVLSDAEKQALGTGLTYVQSAPNIGSSLGAQSYLVMLVGFTDTPSARPYSSSDITAATFGSTNSVNSYFKESSYNQASIVGDVTPWLDLPFASDDCTNLNNSVVYDAALNAAKGAGYNLNSYSHYVFLMPMTTNNGGCQIGGGASGNMIVVNTIFYANNPTSFKNVLTHEVGHSLNIGVLEHSSTLNCGSKIIDLISNCTTGEYGDPADVMGNTNYGLFSLSGPHRVQLSWIPDSSIQTVTTSGTYTIQAVENSTGTKLLKIAKPDIGGSYYIEYRQPIGLDSSMPSGFFGGAGILLLPVTSANSNTGRLDMTPGDVDTYTVGSNFTNSTMKDNDTFVDNVSGMTIKQLSHNSSGVTLQVTFANQGCKAQPTVTVSPTSQNGSTYQYMTYNVTVKNNDPSGCADANFDIVMNSAGTQSGLKLENAVQTGTIAPGSTKVTALRVVPSDPFKTGTLNFALTAKDLMDPSRFGDSAQLSYFVDSTCSRYYPSINVSNPALSGVRGQTVTYNVVVRSNDGGSCPTSTYKLYGHGGGWTFSDPVNLQIPVGGSASATVSVTSPMDAVSTTNLSISTLDSDNTKHTQDFGVTYTITGLTCNPIAPTFTLANPNLNGNPGEALNYSLRVSNNDPVECQNRVLQYDVVGLPTGFTTINLYSSYPPSTSVTINQPITSPVNAVNGTYNFTIYLADHVTGVRFGSVAASYKVINGSSGGCTRSAPTITVSPTNQTGQAGQALSYAVTTTNNDSSGCTSTTFANSASNLPSGFASTTANTASLAPGASGSTTISVTSTSTATGTNNFTVTTNDPFTTGHSASTTASYVVSAPLCTRSAPTVTLSPTSQTGVAGSNQNYSVSVKNNDSTNCASANFSLSTSSLPSGFTSSFSPTSLNLSQGNTGTATLTVNSSPNAINGTNSFTVLANDTSVSGHTASASGNYVVNNPACIRSAPTMNLSPSYNSGLAGDPLNYTATIYNNDASNCASSTFNLTTSLPSGVTSTLNPTSVTLAAGNFKTVSVVITAHTTDFFTLTASDTSVSNHNTSATGSYAVYLPACTRAAPTINLSPSSNTGAAGSNQSYTATIYNNDGINCTSSTFNIATNLPSGFNSSASLNSVTLAGGNFKAVTIYVTSPSYANNGTSSFTVNASDTTVPNHTGTANATYVVNTPVVCTRSAPTISLSPTSQSGAAGSNQYYTVSVRNNDSSSCASSTFSLANSNLSGFSSSFSPSSLTLSAGSTGSSTLSVTSPSYASNGSNSFTISANDAAISGHYDSTSGNYTVANVSNCVRQSPTITVNPSTQYVSLGQNLSYTISLRNNDSTSCFTDTRSFYFNTYYTPGYTLNGGVNINAAPGSTSTGTLNLTFTTRTTPIIGTNTFTIYSSDSYGSYSATANYVIGSTPVCTRSAPTISLSPYSQTGAAGSSQAYTATITNNDSNSCASSTFNISTSLPSGYSSSAGQTSLTLSAGGTGSVNIYVTSPSYATNGSNSFTVTANDSGISNHYSSANGNYTVSTQAVCTRSAPTMTLSPSSQTGAAGSSQSYTATVYNNDGINCPSSTFNIATSLPSGFTSSSTLNSFSLAGGNFKTVTVNITSPSYASNGTSSFTVSANDSSIANHNVSANSSYIVNNPVSCIRSAATVSLSPSDQTSLQGTTASYTATVYNNDSNTCPSTTFNMTSYYLPSDITASFSPSSFTLAGGNFKVVTVSLTSSQYSYNGGYMFLVYAVDSALSGHSGSATAYLTLDNSTSTGRVRGDSTTIPIDADQFGKLIKMDGTYYITTNGGLIGIPSIDVLKSWGYSLSQAVEGSSADRQLFQIKVLSFKQPQQLHPWD